MADSPAITDSTKADQLINELEKARRDAASNRWGRKFWNKISWYIAVGCTATGSILGFIPDHQLGPFHVQVAAWVVSLFTACGAGIEVFRSKTVWSDEEAAYAEYRDTLFRILTRLRYELSYPVSSNDVAQAAREWSDARQAVTQALNRINKRSASARMGVTAAPDKGE